MLPAIITLAYRQLIDANAASSFEKEIFHITYSEFLIQQQSFSKGQELFTWAAIREKFPKSNPALPFKVSFAIAGLLQSLDKKIPGLEDNSGTGTLRFINHRFELIASHIKDPSAHVVAITYLTGKYTLLQIIGDTLLLAAGDVRNVVNEMPVPTFQIRLQPGLSICSLTATPAVVISAPQASMSPSP